MSLTLSTKGYLGIHDDDVSLGLRDENGDGNRQRERGDWCNIRYIWAASAAAKRIPDAHSPARTYANKKMCSRMTQLRRREEQNRIDSP